MYMIIQIISVVVIIKKSHLKHKKIVCVLLVMKHLHLFIFSVFKFINQFIINLNIVKVYWIYKNTCILKCIGF